MIKAIITMLMVMKPEHDVSKTSRYLHWCQLTAAAPSTRYHNTTQLHLLPAAASTLHSCCQLACMGFMHDDGAQPYNL